MQLVSLVDYSFCVQSAARWPFSPYPLSVQQASYSQLPSDRIDGEGTALISLHDGEPDVIVRRSVKILSHHLIDQKKKKTNPIINTSSLINASNDSSLIMSLNVIYTFTTDVFNSVYGVLFFFSPCSPLS